MTLAVCVAGVTGWTGRAVTEAVLAADDLSLVSGVSRSAAGRDVGEILDRDPIGVPVHATVADAVRQADVLIDYTTAEAVRGHVLTAIAHGVSVVVGSSGLSAEDYRVIDAAARQQGVGVIAAGNFSITAAVLLSAALLAARHLPSWEVIDYASASKPDAPSGTAREIGERMAQIRQPTVEIAVAETVGSLQSRGTSIGGSQVHSVRLPGFVLATEVVFGLPDERLILRHDAGSSAAPYVAGTMLAARAVTGRVGLTRGLDTLLLGPS